MGGSCSVTRDEAALVESLTGAPALRIAGVSHSYGKRKALDDVSFAVAQGSFSVLLGLNGAGKSTLFSLITRLFVTRTGTIDIFCFDVTRDSGEALRRLGVVFQARTLDLDLSILQNLVYHAALHGIGPRDAKARSNVLLAQIGLADRAKDKTRNLSGGQMRRVEIARALLHFPNMLLLDEPTVGLDIKARADIIGHVRERVANERLSVLWTTHLIDEVVQDDDVIVLHKGRILAAGKARDIIAKTGARDMRLAFAKLTGADVSDGAST
jgi:ABC-2 type transport system ATP-binding protein